MTQSANPPLPPYRSELRTESIAAYGIVVLAFVAPWVSIAFSRVMSWLPALALVAAAPLLIRSVRLKGLRPSLPVAIACITLLYAAILAHKTPDPLHSLTQMCQVASVVCMVHLLVVLADELPASANHKVGIAFLAGIAIALIVLFVLLVPTATRAIVDKRLGPDLSEFNRALVIIVLYLPLVFGLIMSRVSGLTGLTSCVVVTAFASVVAFHSFSESAKVAVLLVLPIFLAFWISPRSAALAGSMFVAVLMLSAPWLATVLYDFALGHPSNILAQRPLITRLEIWSDLAALIPANPIFGLGPEAVRESVNLPLTKRLYEGATLYHPHSLVVQTWVELGLVGVFLMVSLFVISLLSLARDARSPRTSALGAALLVFFVVGAGSHGMWQTWWLGAASLVPILAVVLWREPESDTTEHSVVRN